MRWIDLGTLGFTMLGAFFYFPSSFLFSSLPYPFLLLPRFLTFSSIYVRQRTLGGGGKPPKHLKLCQISLFSARTPHGQFTAAF